MLQKTIRLAARTGLLCAGLCTALVFSPATARAAGKDPIRIGVIAPTGAVVGKGIIRGAKLAVADLNAHGGINGRPIKLFSYDDALSASTAVRDFQRLVQQDKVVAVIGTWLSEAALALEPWSARLKVPYIVANAGSPEISKRVHAQYDRYKYVFSMLPNSVLMADTVCNFVHHSLVGKMGASRGAILSENAKWTLDFDKTFEKCLPKAGLKVTSHVRFSKDTDDFTPIYQRIENGRPGIIVTGLSHTGLKATVQWRQRRVPSLPVGMNALAQAQGFWDQSNGNADGVVTLSGPIQGVDLTPKTKAYMQAFIKRFGDKVAPGFGATTYDAFHILKAAVERADSTDPDKLVTALEQTDYVGVGTTDPVRFRGRKDPYTHNSTYRMIMVQWQNGKRVPVWPADIAKPVHIPDFVSMGKK